MPLLSNTQSAVELLVDAGEPITTDAIVADLENDIDLPLYLATEEQINKLIEIGRIDEDYASKFQDAQEELRVLKADDGFMESFFSEVQAGVGADMKIHPMTLADMDEVIAVEGVKDSVTVTPHDNNNS